MHHDPFASLDRLSELETRYDGPIPASERRALIFGSALAGEIADTRAEIAFLRAMVARTRRAGKTWLSRGNRAMAAHARADSELYLSAWRDRRRRLAELAQQMRIDGTARRILATIPSDIAARSRKGTRENRP
jgi:hypothetical protein